MTNSALQDDPLEIARLANGGYYALTDGGDLGACPTDMAMAAVRGFRERLAAWSELPDSDKGRVIQECEVNALRCLAVTAAIELKDLGYAASLRAALDADES